MLVIRALIDKKIIKQLVLQMIIQELVELVRMKLLSPDKVRAHNQRSVLERCLGFNLFVQPDVFKVPVQNNDIIILCSDGVWSVVEDDEFAKLL